MDATPKGQRFTSWDENGWRDSDYGETGMSLSRIRWFDDEETSPYVSMVWFDPGHRAEVHSHASDYCEIILEGSETVGRTSYGPGSVRVARGGTFYGPLIAGPEGCRKLVIMRDGSRGQKLFPPRASGKG